MVANKMEFDNWLTNKLRSLDLDEETFLDYLKGVLADDGSTDDDKREALCGVLSGAMSGPVEPECDEILKEWQSCNMSSPIDSKEVPSSTVSSSDRIRSIIQKQQSTTAPSKGKKVASNEAKDRLLAKYSHVSDEEDIYDSDGDEKKSGGQIKDLPIYKNENAKAVVDKQRAQREKQKRENDEKKVRDKQNREMEKVKRQERQDKEKKRTQKGEKRR